MTTVERIETGDELLANAQLLAPMLRDAAEEIDEARRLPSDIVAALRQAGCFRMSMPREWGGCEADPMAQNRVIEAIAAASGSAGWCVMIAAANAYFTAFLDQAVAREMFPDVNMVIAAALAPPARAEVAPGGYRVSGRLPFASGITHSAWVAAGSVVVEHGRPAIGDDGLPRRITALAPIHEVEVLDTWRSGGLRGTGSNDFSFNGVFVPEEHVFTLDGPSKERTGPLYRLPTLFLANHPGVPLGLGRGAIDEFMRVIREKPGRFGPPPREQPSVQAALANATVLVESARTFVFTALEALWQSLVAGGTGTAEERIRLRLAIVHAHDACARAVQQLYHAAGSASVYVPNTLDRQFRDIHTADQHVIAGASTYELGGRALLTGSLPQLW